MVNTEDTPLTNRIIWKKDQKEMVYIPQGHFLMGSNESLANERPTHWVYVDAFYIDRYPVTNQEYKHFIEATGHPVPYCDAEWARAQDYNWDPEKRIPPPGKEDHPVVLVSWEDARTYAAWANKRLPSEAEWERAARGTNGGRWPWGSEFTENFCNTKECQINSTSPIGKYSPYGDSPTGIGDAVGNVWEWTLSLFQPYPYDPHDGRENPQTEGWRVLRGGSWSNSLNRASCTARLDGDFLFYSNVGFRCAVSAKESHESMYITLFRKAFKVPRSPYPQEMQTEASEENE